MPDDFRVGIGYDIHAVVKGRPLRLGGVHIACDFGLGGHTDGDVVLHALVDALFGAAGLPDIGEAFPDTADDLRGADSRMLFREALSRVHACGYHVGNVDVTIMAETPRLGKCKSRIRSSLAELTGIKEQQVSVKAKTHEGFDAVGSQQAIACHVVALLKGK